LTQYHFVEVISFISVFVALSDVELENGPTYLFAGSNTKAFHNAHVKSSSSASTIYNSEGELDLMDADVINRDIPSEIDRSSENSPQLPPVYAKLSPGDMLLFDTRLLHFGGANTSASPRALLSMSFQRREACGEKAELVSGFTYHQHPSLHDAPCILNDFYDP